MEANKGNFQQTNNQKINITIKKISVQMFKLEQMKWIFMKNKNIKM